MNGTAPVMPPTTTTAAHHGNETALVMPPSMTTEAQSKYIPTETDNMLRDRPDLAWDLDRQEVYSIETRELEHQAEADQAMVTLRGESANPASSRSTAPEQFMTRMETPPTTPLYASQGIYEQPASDHENGYLAPPNYDWRLNNGYNGNSNATQGSYGQPANDHEYEYQIPLDDAAWAKIFADVGLSSSNLSEDWNVDQTPKYDTGHQPHNNFLAPATSPGYNTSSEPINPHENISRLRPSSSLNAYLSTGA